MPGMHPNLKQYCISRSQYFLKRNHKPSSHGNEICSEIIDRPCQNLSSVHRQRTLSRQISFLVCRGPDPSPVQVPPSCLGFLNFAGPSVS